MFCKTCGKEVPDNAAHCPFCGKALNEAPAAAPAPVAAPAPAAPVKTKVNPLNIIGFVFAMVAVIMWGVAFAKPLSINSKFVLYLLLWIFPLLGLSCSIVGLATGKKLGKGLRGMGVCGIVFSSICLLLTFIFYFIVASFFAAFA